MKNKLLSGLLAITMLFSMFPTTVLATGEITSSGSCSDVPAVIDQDATTFSVTVPTSLPVYVDGDGVVTVATDNKIINNSYGPVEVKSIEVQPKNDWVLVDFSTDFTSKKVGLKEFGFQINDADVQLDGTCEAEFAIIAGNGSLSFTYDAVVARQKVALSDVQIASVVFTVGWADSNAEDVITGYEITPVTELDVYDDGSLILDNGESADLSAVATYSLETPTWSSSNSDVVTVSEDGVMTAVAPGYAEITYGTSRVSETIGVWVPDSFELTSSDYSLINYTKVDSELIIPKYVMDTNNQLKKVTSIGNNAFRDNTYLTDVVIPESVNSIQYSAFYGCTSLASINIPDGITSIDNSVFRDCASLNNIIIPDSVTSIGGSSFSGCNGLTSITIPENITSIGDYAFFSCYNLENVLFSEKLTSIGQFAFWGCTNLGNIVLPDNLMFIGNCAFAANEKLTYVKIPANIDTLSGVFAGCKALINIDTSLNENFKTLDGVLYNSDMTHLIQYPAGKTDISFTVPESVVCIDSVAMWDCDNLITVEMPSENLIAIGDGAFENSNNLQTITISQTVTYIGKDSISKCSSLSTINYSGTEEEWNTITFGENWDTNTGNYTINFTETTPRELKIITQPTDASAAVGEFAVTTVIAQGDGLSYQWYYKDIGQTEFTISVQKTKSYSALMENAYAYTGRQIYCVITDAYGQQVTTNTVTIFSDSLDTLVSASDYTGVYDGSSHGITVTCDGATITYSTSENGTYSSTNPTYTNAGVYITYYKVEKIGYTTVIGSKTVNIEKAENLFIFADGASEGTIKLASCATNGIWGIQIFTFDNPSGGEISITTSNPDAVKGSVEDGKIYIRIYEPWSEGLVYYIYVTSEETTNYKAVTKTYIANITYGQFC